MIFFGRPTPINRFLGQVDQDDPTNLPMGLAAVCRNSDFTRDSPGVTCVNTRAGNNLTMQGLNQAPITGMLGFLYLPELPGEQFFQMPLIFDALGALQRENPVGLGHMQPIPQGNFTPPANSHMLAAQAGNRVWMAFSDLDQPTSGMASFDPSTLELNPFGMKPFGWTWQPNTAVIVGEMCTPPSPASGNGHTYRCVQAGVTGANPPVFPTAEDAQFNDGTAVWQELTMVIANRLAPPPSPVLTLAGGGNFAANVDVWVGITLDNNQGESLMSALVKVTTLAAGTSVSVALPALAALPGWERTLPAQFAPNGCNVYVAETNHGNPQPPFSAFARALTNAALGTAVGVGGPGTGAAPPGTCTARVTPGKLPTPDTLPQLTRAAAAGTFPAGRDVYVLQTYTNAAGETRGGPAASVVNTSLDDGVQVTVQVPLDPNGVALYQIASVGIYEADVATGTPAPSAENFALVGYFEPGATPMIAASSAGSNPPAANTTGPGGDIVADNPTGGLNGSQGYRYAAAMFMNTNETVSGFTAASVVSTIVDEDGWELGAFNVATGPANVVARIVAFTIADGTQDGPFNWIGLVDLKVPSQNFVYPQTEVSDGAAMTATVFLDNATTQGTFNFTDTYLIGSNDATDRLRIMAPPSAVRVEYLRTLDRLALIGAPGYPSAVVISLGEDYESFYGDTSPVPVSGNGERIWGITDKFRGIPFILRERSGFVMTPNTGDPASYQVRQRWDQVGPCGPRAWDACGEFIIFVHRSGIYLYQETDPILVSKEIPRMWSTINWAAERTICCTIDDDTRTVRVQVPTGNSTVPNQEFCLSYLSGWNDPIHFSTFKGTEISMDAARKFSFNDVAAFVCARMERVIPNQPLFPAVPEYNAQMDASFYRSQLLYGSSAADGAVQARTPGVYSDNGNGIDWRYRTVSVGMMQAVCKIEGFNLNASGSGIMTAAFLTARDSTAGPQGSSVVVKARDVALRPDQNIGITRKVAPKLTEFASVEFTNGKVPGAWASLKAMTVYLIPWTVGRGELDK